ncbi:MAG: thiol:disulfide interchange protein DsbA/DsbL [Azoarcus sp.]|jgi:thiol:disulfide interchange protein DsbA|nr:thiol:disulfide interchange protein DsbA/DsbL [Azoarcus sp.]
MNRRTALQQFGALALLAGSAGRVLAQVSQSFKTLDRAIPSEVEGKIEVLEFFHYGCPHCRDFDPLITQWEKKLAADVAFARVPATWDEGLRGLARLYYALDISGHADRVHKLVFAAIQDERVPLNKEDAVRSWIGKQGVDAKVFMEIYQSFGVQAKVQRADQLMRAYQIDGVPAMAVAGRFLTSASINGNSHATALKVVDQLIARVRAKQ